MANTSSGITFSNSGAAGADTYNLTEDSLGSIKLNVMSNDGGGAKTTLYSIDDGVANSGVTTNGGVSINTDLLTQDAVGAIGYTSLGAKIWINADNTIQYDASSFASAYQSLASGTVVTDRFTYAIKMSNGTLAWTTVEIKIAGVNDTPKVVGALTTTATEEGIPVSLNLLTGASDVDSNSVLHVELNNALPPGFTLTNSTLTINPSSPAFQHLAAGVSDTITVQYKVVDQHGAYVNQSASFKITGVNDIATISGKNTGSITEDAVSNQATGLLAVSDVDDGEAKIKPCSQSNEYGTFTVGADGAWKFVADNSALQKLGEGVKTSVSFEVKSADGTASKTVTIELVGVNDAASVTGKTDGSVTEDSNSYEVTGKLTVADADDGEAKMKAGSQGNTFGTLAIDADGNWKFVADNDALQKLGQGIVTSASFQVKSLDGTATHTVTIDLTGVNDAATISGDDSGAVAEDSTSYEVNGTLSVADVDDGENKLKASTQSNAYGSFTVDANGAWTFVADNAALQHLGAGDETSVSFTVESEDATDTHTVTIDLAGVNDTAVIVAGNDTGSVTEDAAPNTVTGNLSNTDVDNANDQWQAANVSGAGHYGTLVMNAAGEWTYTLDNTNATVNGLNTGGTLTDSFTVKTADNQDKVINVTINGKNDLAVIVAGNDTGSVTEDAVPNTVIGNLSNTDVDNANDQWQAANVSGAGHYGQLMMNAAGEWTYTLDNTNATVNGLNTGGTLTDSFTVKTADNQDKVINVTINGRTDVTTLPTAFTGTGDPNDFDANGSAAVTPITADSSGNAYGGAGNDTITGNNSGSLTDHLYGGSGNDTINALNGDDQLFGGSGNDTLNGNNQNDLLVGGFGVDVLTGSSGADTFQFRDLRDTNDTITDFLVGTDKIDFQALYSGTLLYDAGHIGTGSVNAHSVSWFTSGGNTVVIADTDGDTSTAEFMVTLTGSKALTAADFLL